MRWVLSFICDRIKSFSRGSFCPVNKGKQLRMQKQTQEAKGWWRSNHIVKTVCWKNCLCLQTRACVCLLVSFFCFSLDKCGLLMFWQSGFWPAESSRDLLRAPFIFPFFFFLFGKEQSLAQGILWNSVTLFFQVSECPGLCASIYTESSECQCYSIKV